jgi:hypothetical protein
MRTFIFLLCGVTLASAQASSLDANAGATPVTANPASQTIVVGYQTGEQGANENVWQKIVQQTDGEGNVTCQTNNAYMELATGLNHLVNGQWVESKEEIDISADGNSALATNGQHQAYFPGDIYSGQIELVTPDGKQLYSRPVGLSYFDGTNSVLIAELTNSTGQVVGNNQVIYTNAFTDLGADIRYTYTKAGFEQDIILREQPPIPASFGLNPDTTRLQVLTEFFDPPQPTVITNTTQTPAGNLEDDNLNFGIMAMMPGKAFLLGTNSPSAGVDKQWLLLDGRQMLVEEVPVVSIADELENLPLPQTTSSQPHPPLNIVSTKHLLPEQRLATVPNRHPMQMAQVTPASRGLVLDYVTMTSQTNYTFRGDTTYYISGTVNLSGTNTFEGGAVLKYTNSGSAKLVVSTTVSGNNLWTFQTAPYRPVIFTSMNDNSVGDSISGSTGSPTNNDAALMYLDLPGDNGYPAYPIQNARFAYAGTAIYQETRVNCSPIVDCQFVQCDTAVEEAVTALFSTPVQKLYNVLMSKCGVGVLNVPYYSLIVDGENITVDQMADLLEGPVSTISGTFTNCILTGISTYLFVPGGSGTITYNDCVQPSSGSGIYQTVGAGNYYLATGSTNQNVGTTNIDSTLLADLRKKTTYPPLLLTNQTVTINNTLNAQAQRDTDAPDLGYHYDPIDYLVDNYAITNATLTVTNGVAIASYNETGIQLQNGSAIVSIGSPLYPNWFVRYTSVQEKANLLGGTNLANGVTVNAYDNGSVWPTGQYLFSKFACPAGSGYLFNLQSGSDAYSSLLIQNCELWSGAVSFGGNTNTVTTLQNNLFNRSTFSAYAGTTTPTFLLISNNLFFGTTVFFYNDDTAATNNWQAYNNAFDTCGIDNSQGMYGLTFGQVPNGYNAYLNCTNNFSSGYLAELSPTNASDIVTNGTLAYQTSWLGSFYQPTNSPLINKGSTNANLVGLYHFTVTTNEVVEGTNTVSIGYHYVATDANGIPISTPQDGIPDYLADANGNGLVDAGEISWTNYDSINGLTGGNGVLVFTPLK